jgi:putative peptidoglycan lipid II flippase
LYFLLRKHGHVQADARFKKRLLRQILASAVMGVVVAGLVHAGMNGLERDWFLGPTWLRVAGMSILVTAGLITYFGVGSVVGAFDREQIYALARRKRKAVDK